MSTRIESTVEDLPTELANSGVSGKQRVFVTVYDDDETAKIMELRKLMDEAEASGEYVDSDEAFADIRRSLEQNDAQ